MGVYADVDRHDGLPTASEHCREGQLLAVSDGTVRPLDPSTDETVDAIALTGKMLPSKRGGSRGASIYPRNTSVPVAFIGATSEASWVKPPSVVSENPHVDETPEFEEGTSVVAVPDPDYGVAVAPEDYVNDDTPTVRVGPCDTPPFARRTVGWNKAVKTLTD